MQFDFAAFERDFREACIGGVELLAERYNADVFYAVSIYVEGHYGDFDLYANTVVEFERTLSQYRAKYPEAYGEPLEIKELKYNCGDWLYRGPEGVPQDFASCLSPLARWGSRFRELGHDRSAVLCGRLTEVACRIALSDDLSQACEKLRQSGDFLVTVSEHDESALASIYRPAWYAEKGSLEGFDPSIYGPYAE